MLEENNKFTEFKLFSISHFLMVNKDILIHALTDSEKLFEPYIKCLNEKYNLRHENYQIFLIIINLLYFSLALTGNAAQ